MNIEHISLVARNKKKIEEFFTKILEIPLIDTFSVPKKLAEKIFDIAQEIEVCLFKSNHVKFEVFISKERTAKKSYAHVCLSVKNRSKIIENCKQHKIEVNYIPREKKTALLFIKDPSGNLFEIKDENLRIAYKK